MASQSVTLNCHGLGELKEKIQREEGTHKLQQQLLQPGWISKWIEFQAASRLFPDVVSSHKVTSQSSAILNALPISVIPAPIVLKLQAQRRP